MRHASLFSGIGAAEIAAEMNGWENVFHCEINPFGRRVLEYWFPNSVSYEDITKTNFSEWRGKIDVLTGGFPCQPFSYAGKRGWASR
jgi:DNA (cytosine-5)-methyltransferase 1